MSSEVRLGLQVPQAGPNAAAGFVRDFVHRGHDGGFRMFWVGDHILMGGFSHRAKEHETFLEPLVLLSYIAGGLDDIELGTSVLIAPYRNAFSVMKSIATLTHLTQHRLAVGIGAGWAEHEFDALGVPFRRRQREAMAAVRGRRYWMRQLTGTPPSALLRLLARFFWLLKVRLQPRYRHVRKFTGQPTL